jgi:tetratricopeptide (TPR) repeat protein
MEIPWDGYIVAEFKRALKSQEVNPDLWRNLDYAGLHKGSYGGTERALQESLRIAPSDASAWFTLGEIAAQRDQNLEAIAKLQKAIQYRPRFIRAWELLGLLYFDLNDYENAEKCYQKWTELEPESFTAWRGLGDILLKAGKPKEAKEIYRKAQTLNPDHPWVERILDFLK